MAEWLVQNEAALRLGLFLSILGLAALLQWRFPLRGDGHWARRQATNLGLVLLGTALARIALPVLAVGWAVTLEARGEGVLNALALPPWLKMLVAVLVLDLAIYWQHRLFHRIPWLWRLHRVHHSDIAFDVTTGVRFHPLELLLSLLIKLAVIRILGAPPAAVVTFEILLSAGALLTHTDCALPAWLDRRVRWILVTPSMHRIHHSPHPVETDSNYGFHLSVWDRIFRSYRVAPATPEASMAIGLERWRTPDSQRFWSLLRQPLDALPSNANRTSTDA